MNTGGSMIERTPATDAAPRPGTEPERLQHAPGCWWVLHVRARNEKRVAEALGHQGVGFYLPLLGVRRTYAKSKFTFNLPLFPGYMFLHGEREACEVALKTNRVAQILEVPDQPRLSQELTHIAQALASSDTVELFTGIQVGKRYRVTRGPMKDIEGVVVQRERHWRMCLAVTMLGQSACVEVDAAALEPVE